MEVVDAEVVEKAGALVPAAEITADIVRLGTLQMRSSEIIAAGAALAGPLARLIKDRNLSLKISGREYVRAEGWTTLGAMLGITPREIAVQEVEGDFIATIELIRASDGECICRASAIVGADEERWQERPRYARRSMAVTRATGKAFRLAFSWIMVLAGYEATPAEEMEGLGEHSPRPAAGKPANCTCADRRQHHSSNPKCALNAPPATQPVEQRREAIRQDAPRVDASARAQMAPQAAPGACHVCGKALLESVVASCAQHGVAPICKSCHNNNKAQGATCHRCAAAVSKDAAEDFRRKGEPPVCGECYTALMDKEPIGA